MMTVKDLLENEELLSNIVEDLDDIPEDAEVLYAVWAIGYDKDDEVTDCDYLIGEFDNADEAIACAEDFTIEKFNAEYQKPYEDTTYLSIEVETVIADPEDEDCGTMNVGTVYHREIPLVEEEDINLDINLAVAITTKDYTILDDGTLKIKRGLLTDYNKNDYVLFEFIDEPTISFLEYKIVSKVEYEDGDYFHCELTI